MKPHTKLPSLAKMNLEHARLFRARLKKGKDFPAEHREELHEQLRELSKDKKSQMRDVGIWNITRIGPENSRSYLLREQHGARPILLDHEGKVMVE